MDHEYYKEYYNLERTHWWFVARENIICNYIRKLISTKQLKATPIKILNIGCSTGRSSEYLSGFGHTTSIEYDKFCCEFAAQKTGLEIINGSITELPFIDGQFDLVCAFDVIEHVEDDTLAVSEMSRVTKSDGLLLLTVPAFTSLWGHHDEINHHFRRYKLSSLKELFIPLNGTKIFYSYFNFFLFPPIFFFRKLSNILKIGKKRKGSGSDFEAFNPGLLNTALFKILNSESKLINRNIKLPFGVSILYCWKKI